MGDGDARFPPAARLRKPDEFKRVFAAGRRVAAPQLVLLGLANQLGRARLGLAIAKRYIPQAVARNRIKRLIRESFRGQQRQFDALDIVVLARPGLAELDNDTLRLLLQRQWAELLRRCARS